MAGLCKVTIIGNLGRDPEKRYTQDGRPITRFSVAATTRRQREGEWQDHTEWFGVTVFGTRAETLVDRLSKGSRVYVEGRLESRTYESGGQTRVGLDVIANEVVLLDSRQRDDSGEMGFEPVGAERSGRGAPAAAPAEDELEDLPF